MILSNWALDTMKSTGPKQVMFFWKGSLKRKEKSYTHIKKTYEDSVLIQCKGLCREAVGCHCLFIVGFLWVDMTQVSLKAYIYLFPHFYW